MRIASLGRARRNCSSSRRLEMMNTYVVNHPKIKNNQTKDAVALKANILIWKGKRTRLDAHNSNVHQRDDFGAFIISKLQA